MADNITSTDDDMATMMMSSFLTEGQEITLSLLTVFSSCLSLLGSSTIIYKVLMDLDQATSYDRLLLGLSLSDWIASVGFAMTPFLTPAETSDRTWAVGTDATCSMVGFLTQLGLSSVLYNGFLSYYYLLTIRFGMSKQVFGRKVEPWIHGITLIFSLTTSTVGLGIGVYSELEVGMGCWVNNYPEGCVGDECLSIEIGMVYAVMPAVFTLLSLAINNVMVYRHVRKAFFGNRTTAASVNSTTMSSPTSSTRSLQGQPVQVSQDRQLLQQFQIKELATQGFLYVAAFVFCFWSAIAVRLMEVFTADDTAVDESKIFWMLVLQSIGLPLQGFFNVFIYTRPKFKRVRAAYPDMRFLAALKVACFDPHIPKLTVTMVRSGSFSGNGSRKQLAPFPLNQHPTSSADRSKSGCNFSSNLQQIREISDEERSNDNDEDFSSLGSCKFTTKGRDSSVIPNVNGGMMAIETLSSGASSSSPADDEEEDDVWDDGDDEGLMDDSILKVDEDGLSSESEDKPPSYNRVHMDGSFSFMDDAEKD